jgi:ESCRT-II complex subunit VPS36
MVAIAEKIKSSVAKLEAQGEGQNSSDELKQIQSVMFNMGLVNNFSSQVSKDISGKNFHEELAREIEKFIVRVIDNFGGVLGLVDLYCMYNRARGTDLISPEDLLIACSKLNMSSQSVMLRKYKSGVQTVQSRKFKEDDYYQSLADKLKTCSNGMTAEQLARQLKINIVLVKEQIKEAE